MNQPARYTLCDLDGRYQFTGTAVECAEYIGCNRQQFLSSFGRWAKIGRADDEQI